MARHFDSHQGEPGLLASVPDSGGSEANLTSPERSYRSYRILLLFSTATGVVLAAKSYLKRVPQSGDGACSSGRRGLLLARLRRRPLPDRRPSRSSGFVGRLRLDRGPMCRGYWEPARGAGCSGKTGSTREKVPDSTIP